MKTYRRLLYAVPVAMGVAIGCQTQSIRQVGPLGSQDHLTPAYQLLRPAGQSVAFNGRPIDQVLSPDSSTLFVKDNRGLVMIDVAAWTVRQELKLSEGGSSVCGLVITRDGTRLFVSTAQNALWEAKVAANGKVSWGNKITLAGPGGKGNSHAAGIALSADEDTLNRIIWHSVKGADKPYPAQFAGAHGKGLKGLRLISAPEPDD